MNTDTHAPEFSYVQRQRARDVQYREAYEVWVASLPPEERRKLKAQGLDAPFLPGAASGMSDAASSPRARCEAAEIPEDEGNLDAADAHEPAFHAEEAAPADQSSHAADTELLHALLRRLVGQLIGQSQMRLSVECLALVTGLGYDGASMTEIGRRHGVTRAAVSKRCVELSLALGLNPARAMRTRDARSTYRSTRTLSLRHSA